MGGTKEACYRISRTIWEWCIERKIWLSACHLPGVDNTEADRESRLNHDNTEWKLNPLYFHTLGKIWTTPNIDLFASRINFQIYPYVAWKPDPEAVAIDAFTIPWDQYCYAFPPFCLIGKALAKIEEEKASGILIAPLWITQSWFSKLGNMLIDCPLLFPRSKDTLILPYKPLEVHPLSSKMRLAAFHVSGNPLAASTFRSQLKKFSCRHGDHQHKSSMDPTLDNWWNFAVKGVTITAHPLWEL